MRSSSNAFDFLIDSHPVALQSSHILSFIWWDNCFASQQEDICQMENERCIEAFQKDIIWTFEAENSTVAEERRMSFKNLGHNYDSCNGSLRGHGIMDRALALSQIGPGSKPAIPNGLLSPLVCKEERTMEPDTAKISVISASKKMNQSWHPCFKWVD